MELKKATVGIGVSALMIAGAFLAGGVLQGSSSAQSATPAIVAVAQPQTTPESQATEVAEPVEPAGPDTDNVQDQVGDQNAPDNEGVETDEGAEGAEGADDSASEAAEAQALAAQATITKQQAEQTALAANPGTTVVKSELDDENGAVVYSVELSNGSDVHVDAKSGSILTTDAAGSENEAEGPEGAEGAEGPEGPENTQGQPTP